MAFSKEVARAKPAVLRITGALRQRLERLLFSRYPDKEWGTFFLFGTHELPDGVVVTIVDLIEPQDGDLDSTTAIVRFNEPYALRAALEKQERGLCVGIIHSHPQNCRAVPSPLDDDIDGYFKSYFPAFGREAAYFSLIFSRTPEGSVRFSGRGWKDGQAFRLTEMVTVSEGEVLRSPLREWTLSLHVHGTSITLGLRKSMGLKPPCASAMRG